MDPNVQVAAVSVIATVITTAGVVIVALINNRKERVKSASAGVEAALDERDVLERLLYLNGENERKDVKIEGLETMLAAAQEDNRRLRSENANLILQVRNLGGSP